MASTTLLTFEEFERVPDEPGKMELLDGELIRLPPAKKKHRKMSHRLLYILKPLVEEGAVAGVGEVYVEMGYKIGPQNWFVPDVSIEHANQPESDYSEGAPALAVEVISESNTAEQVDYKVKTYLANGGTEVWVVYPKTHRVWVFRQGHVEEFRDVLKSELVPGLAIDLGALFA
ncbi:MAG TPA: Uma2 family endonuclease [Bryobacteraceae bacterium]